MNLYAAPHTQVHQLHLCAIGTHGCARASRRTGHNRNTARLLVAILAVKGFTVSATLTGWCAAEPHCTKRLSDLGAVCVRLITRGLTPGNGLMQCTCGAGEPNSTLTLKY